MAHEIDFTTEIKYDRETRDYAVFVNGTIIGYARTYSEGEFMANAYRYDALTKPSRAA